MPGPKTKTESRARIPGIEDIAASKNTYFPRYSKETKKTARGTSKRLARYDTMTIRDHHGDGGEALTLSFQSPSNNIQGACTMTPLDKRFAY